MKAESGFTLVEVLVALVVAAIALLALTQVQGRFVDTQQQLKIRLQAAAIAQNALTRLIAGEASARVLAGRKQVDGRLWQVRITLEKTPVPGAQRVRVAVSVGQPPVVMAVRESIVAP